MYRCVATLAACFSSLLWAQNVGIGTSTPEERLHVYDGRLRVSHSSNSTSYGTALGGLQIQNLDPTVGAINGLVFMNRGGFYTGGIAGLPLGDPNANNGGHLTFWTKRADGTSLGERMRITDVGNVGIGTPNPGARLHISGGLAALGVRDEAGAYAIPNTCGGNWISNATSGIYAPEPGPGGCGDEWYIASYPRAGEARTLEIAMRNDGDDHIALMPSGNVGVGVVEPTERLDVEGNMRVRGLSGAGYRPVFADPNGVLRTAAHWNQPTGTLAGAVPLPLVGGEVVLVSTDWVRVTPTQYNSIYSYLDWLPPVPPGARRKYYLVIRKADGCGFAGVSTYWRFACEGSWLGGPDQPRHGFTLSTDWGSNYEGNVFWVELPSDVYGGNYCYWKIDARMNNGCGSVRIFGLAIAAVDVYGGAAPPLYQAAAGGTAGAPFVSWMYGTLWRNPSGNIGIGVVNPQVRLAVGGEGTNVYATDVWVENNLHVQGNEGLTVGGRGRLRVGTAWGYVGLYAEPNSGGAGNDLVLGASSGRVRVGGDGTGQNLRVTGLAGSTTSLVQVNASGDLRRANPPHGYQYTVVVGCPSVVEGFSNIAQIVNGRLMIDLYDEGGGYVGRCVDIDGVADARVVLLITNDDTGNCGSRARVSGIRNFTVANNGGAVAFSTDLGCGGSDGHNQTYFIHYNPL